MSARSEAAIRAALTSSPAPLPMPKPAADERRDRKGPLGRRERTVVPSSWRVVSEQFRAPDGSWPWDVYLTPVPERRDMIEQMLASIGPNPNPPGAFAGTIPDWETRRLTPRIPAGPNTYDDPRAEEERLARLVLR